ncbi:MAG TPA: hypothetical protein VGN98_02410 [Tianweitania sediminis]|nr:hypothetical protein [Tianweitania sediminis]
MFDHGNTIDDVEELADRLTHEPAAGDSRRSLHLHTQPRLGARIAEDRLVENQARRRTIDDPRWFA